MQKFPFYQQLDTMDCGPGSLRMIAKYYGKNYSLQYLREKCFISREGVSMLGISHAAESIGMRTIGATISFDKLLKDALLPCIVHWKQKHFIVVFSIKKNYVHVADPKLGIIKHSFEEFKKGWISTIKEGEEKGVALFLEPTPDFYKHEDEFINKANFTFLFSYLKPYKKLIFQLFIGVFITSFLQIVFPFLFQSMVDKGIILNDTGFINLILIAWLIVITSRMAVEFLRNWILLHLGTRINIFLISDFLIKLMRLPVKFFDSKFIGDLVQRINDNKRIESFLTGTILNLFYSIISIVVLGIVLSVFHPFIFLIFVSGSALYIGWVLLFMKKRRDLDNKRFSQLSSSQGSIYQIINGMQEIKLNNCERQKRWEWENIQSALFRINIRSLSLNQYQQIGALFFNESKNVLILYFAARMVLSGNLTLGAMMAIAFIIGQMNAPIDQVVQYFHTTQDAKISLERLAEIHTKPDEEPDTSSLVNELPENRGITLFSVDFQYEGPDSPFVLKNINLEIQQNKTTAIVGASGSGKTTLIKLMLGFYEPVSGSIKIGSINLRNFSRPVWRNNCGVVMQDGFIFSDSIARNIAVSDETIDKSMLLYSVRMANIHEFIESLPLGYNTKIGQEGIQISQGQKQRILIARAIYKQPGYVFLDEATNSLDAGNEKIILENMQDFFSGRTVVVVAHRLSTVKNADHIVVLEKGRIVEEGNHKELVAQKGRYLDLIKNQLELGI